MKVVQNLHLLPSLGHHYESLMVLVQWLECRRCLKHVCLIKLNWASETEKVLGLFLVACSYAYVLVKYILSHAFIYSSIRNLLTIWGKKCSKHWEHKTHNKKKPLFSQSHYKLYIYNLYLTALSGGGLTEDITHQVSLKLNPWKLIRGRPGSHSVWASYSIKTIDSFLLPIFGTNH